MPVARPTSRGLGAINVDSTLERLEKEHFLSVNFSLAVVGGQKRHLCIEKLDKFRQSGTGRARPIRMKLIGDMNLKLLVFMGLSS